MMLSVNLSASTTVTIQPAQTKSFSALTINRMVDLPTQQIVKIFTEELPQPIILWSGTSYQAIGDWTNQDVISALQAKF
jgi:hypothetical protein